MERLENRHDLDTQTAIFEEIDNSLSIADLHKRNLERIMANSVNMGHTARSQKLPPEKLIQFLIAAEGGPLAKELHRAGIDPPLCLSAAVKSRPLCSVRCFWTSHPPAHMVSPIVATKATAFWPVTAPQSTWPAIPMHPASSAITAYRGGITSCI